MKKIDRNSFRIAEVGKKMFYWENPMKMFLVYQLTDKSWTTDDLITTEDWTYDKVFINQKKKTIICGSFNKKGQSGKKSISPCKKMFALFFYVIFIFQNTFFSSENKLLNSFNIEIFGMVF